MRKIFIATPAYKEPEPGYYASMIATISQLEAAGYFVVWKMWEQCCYIHTARNKLCAEFLFSGMDELLFVDSDLAWPAKDMVRLCGIEEDIVGAAAPYRMGPEGFPTHPVERKLDSRGLLEVVTLPTAVMKVSKAALLALAADSHCPLTVEYNNRGEELGRYLSFFDFERNGQIEYGEDVTFCRKWLRMGRKLWVDPDFTITHFGPSFRIGNLKEHMFGKEVAVKGVHVDPLHGPVNGGDRDVSQAAL